MARLSRLLGGPLPDPLAASEFDGGYGPLRRCRDETTGLALLKLPEGFRYLSLGWFREPMVNGLPSPPLPDGAAAFADPSGKILVVRNHEIEATQGSFAPELPSYDPLAGGGTTTLVFDPVAERLEAIRPSLTGTLRNCAGGPTPWGSWLSCEETLAGPGDLAGLTKDHGLVFEVPADGHSEAVPLRDLGRFFHEAVAVDPASGDLFLTEDRLTAGLYRFRPQRPGQLREGGKLEMLAIRDTPRADLRTRQTVGATLPVEWVGIPDPLRPHSLEEPGDCLGVFRQGWNAGGAAFARLEGIWHHQGRIYFTATNGGDRGAGQVWAYVPEDERLELLYESPNHQVLTGPDNLTVSPRGGLLICEDGSGRAMQVSQLTSRGVVAPFAINNVRIEDPRHPFQGDFRAKEFTGACFSPDGSWLFVTVQIPGVTFAITGPWERGEL